MPQLLKRHHKKCWGKKIKLNKLFTKDLHMTIKQNLKCLLLVANREVQIKTRRDTISHN